MSAPKYGLDFTYAAFVYPPMFEKPSVTFFSLPLRSGTRTDCRMPPYVRIDTDMPRRFVNVYLSTAVPSGRAPKLAFEMRADCAPAGWASRPAVRPASTTHSAARWIRLDLPMSRMTLLRGERGGGTHGLRACSPQRAVTAAPGSSTSRPAPELNASGAQVIGSIAIPARARAGASPPSAV